MRTCPHCGETKPLTEFYRTKDKRYEARKTERRRAVTVGADGYRTRCKACYGALRCVDKARRAYRQRLADSSGRPYRSLPELADHRAGEKARRKAEARARAAERAESRRAQSPVTRAVALLLDDEPEAASLPPTTITYRARYRYDAEFRARELKRRYDQKLKAPVPDDGTLTGPVLRQLFASAKRCPDCNRRMRGREKTLDHIVPKSRGGVHSILNVRVVCRSCNARKNDRLPDQLTLGSESTTLPHRHSGPSRPTPHAGDAQGREVPSCRVQKTSLPIPYAAA